MSRRALVYGAVFLLIVAGAGVSLIPFGQALAGHGGDEPHEDYECTDCRGPSLEYCHDFCRGQIITDNGQTCPLIDCELNPTTCIYDCGTIY